MLSDPTSSKQLGRGRSLFETSTQTSEWFQFVYRQKWPEMHFSTFLKIYLLMTAVNHLLSFSDKHLLCLVWLVGNYIGFDSLRTKIFLELEITHTSTKCLGICGFSCLIKFCFVFFILRSCKQLFVMLYLPRFNFYFERKLNTSFLCVKTATRVKRGTSVKNHVFASSTRNTSWTLWCEGSGAWWVAWLVLAGTVQLCIKFW